MVEIYICQHWSDWNEKYSIFRIIMVSLEHVAATPSFRKDFPANSLIYNFTEGNQKSGWSKAK